MRKNRKHAVRHLKWEPEDAENEFRTYQVDFEPVKTACGVGRSRRAAEDDQAPLVKVKQILVINFLLQISKFGYFTDAISWLSSAKI